MGKEQSAASTRRDAIAADSDVAWPTPAEVGEIGVEDANPPWNARERTFSVKMQSYSQKSEELQVGTSKLEYFLLGPGAEEISIVSFAENARDEGGYSKFVVLDTRRGHGRRNFEVKTLKKP